MSTPPFVQIEPMQWPSGYGEAVAVVRINPVLFSRAFGLAFFQGSDNLDEYAAAAIRLRSGRRLGLVQHAGAAEIGTEVHADVADDFVAALREFLDAFDLSVEDLSWVRDEVSVEHLRWAAEEAHA